MKLTIKTLPKSSCNKVIKLKNSLCEYKVKVTSAPEHGKANRQIIKLLAEYFEVSPNSVNIVSGTTNNLKIINIDA